MGFPEYSEIPALNFSTLKHMAVSPHAYKYWRDHPRPDTDSYRMGRAVHAAVLEPKAWMDRYAVFAGGRRAGKEWEAFKAENEDKEILKADEVAECYRIHDAVWALSEAADLLENGRAEVTMLWEHEGRACKGRVDYLSDNGALIDLKTAKDVSPRGFGAAAARYLYHAQMAWYAWGLSLQTGNAPSEVILIAAQNVEPYEVAVYRLDDKALAAGEGIFFGWLDRLEKCEAAGTWPGAVEGVKELELPAWATDTGEDWEE